MAGPLPAAVDSVEERRAWRARNGRIWSWVTAEKIVLVGLIGLIYGEVLPGTSASEAEIFIGTGAVVFASAVVTLVTARRHWDPSVATSILLLRLGVNAVLLTLFSALTSALGGRFDLLQAAFFLVLIMVVTTIYDRYHPVFAWRRRQASASAGGDAQPSTRSRSSA